MNPLIKKELRENFKVALIGLAIFAFMLTVIYRSFTVFYAKLALGGAGWSGDNAQPLVSGAFLAAAGFFCAIFGAVLGWVQIHNERHRDLWAFLVHRPLSRTRIFAAKTVAGLALYTFGVALPLVGFIIMTWLPGQIAAPWDWAMVLPVFSVFLSGMVFYFAGMLTSLRQARWYASRGLGLAAALVVSVAAANALEFSRALVLVLVGGAVLAAAAWGSFLSSGYYEGQPLLGRRALTISLMPGCTLVLFLAVGLLNLLNLFKSMPRQQYPPTASYQITFEGGVYIKKAQFPDDLMEVTKLDGTPLIDPKTGHPITGNDFYRLLAPTYSVLPYFRAPNEAPDGSYLQQTHYLTLWRQTADVLWYWRPNGRLWGYDLTSRRFIGSLGPDGFAPGTSTGTARFSPITGNAELDPANPARPLVTGHAVYQLDLDHRAAKLFFETTNNDRIGGVLNFALQAFGWNYTIIVTTTSVNMLTPDGQLVCKAPYAGYPAYGDVEVSRLETTNRFVLTQNPTLPANQTNNLPVNVVWLAAGQGVLTNLDLPSFMQALPSPPPQSWNERLIGLATPPAFLFFSEWFSSRPLTLANFLRHQFIFLWPQMVPSLIGAVVSIGAGWWLGRRYHFTVGSRLKWAAFFMLAGLPGFLAFLCVQEWPARETCPQCKKLRRVDREKCEYCGAGFAPPPRNGIEIFEPAPVSPAGPS